MSLFWPGLQAGGYSFQWMQRLLGRATFVQHVWRGEVKALGQRCSCLVALVSDVSKVFEIFIYASWFGLPMDSWGEPRAMRPEVFRFLQL